MDCIQKWFPVAVQCAQSHQLELRTQSHNLISALLCHLEKMDVEKRVFIEQISIQQFTPMLYSLLKDGRIRLALVLWPLVLKLLRRKLREDANLLNEMLYTPEKALLNPESSIRSIGMESWKVLVDVFCRIESDTGTTAFYKREWIFEKPLIRLFMRPISACWENEKSMDVLTSSIATWRYVLHAAVTEYNAFCVRQEHSFTSTQKFASCHFSRWFNEIVTQPTIKQTSATTPQTPQVLKVIAGIWHAQICTAGAAGHQTLIDNDINQFVLLENPITISLIFFDVLQLLKSLIMWEADQLKALPAIDQIWIGICSRFVPCERKESNSEGFDSKLMARMLRLCLHFGFGIIEKMSEMSDSEAVSAWNKPAKRNIALLYELCTRLSVKAFVSMVTHPRSTVSIFLKRYITFKLPSNCIDERKRTHLEYLQQRDINAELAIVANMVVFLALVADINVGDQESFALCRILALQYGKGLPDFEVNKAFYRDRSTQSGHSITSKTNILCVRESQASRQAAEVISMSRSHRRSRILASSRRGSSALRPGKRAMRWTVRHPSAVVRSLFSCRKNESISDQSEGWHSSAQTLGRKETNQTETFVPYESQALKEQLSAITSPYRPTATTTSSISPAIPTFRTQASQRKRISQSELFRHSHRKRVCRALNKGSHAYSGEDTPRVADRVTFQLPGLSQILRPGQDSQTKNDQSVIATSVLMQEPLAMKLFDKATYHLDRAAVYINKLQLDSERHSASSQDCQLLSRKSVKADQILSSLHQLQSSASGVSARLRMAMESSAAK